ncbi:hypothetical protein [Mangrovicoccus algicola]|uniref:Uncharacterized protein n=1 Tax=Mangrovicoccus algicola TaxID=2771008 RepID=A0A8J6ZFE4_9RHOB|nr:hypothetical protein [Mangrovicoccus algicola]MBE3640526.1 hypothetical protein [Mangrovicoccus algicola]
MRRMVSSPVRQWRLHLGAHKTATTHLQDTLAAHRQALLARDIDYLPVAEARPVLRRNMRPEGLRRKFWSPPVRMLMRRDLERLRRGPATVLLSEEDLLGYTFDQLGDPLYPRLPGLPLIRALGQGGAGLHLFLAVRSLDALIPSAYAQMIRALPPEPGGFDAVRARLDRQPPTWCDLVARLRDALPGAALTVWRYEDWRSHWRALLDRYVGAPAGPYPELPPPASTLSPSPRAVAEAEALDRSLPMAARLREAEAIYARYPAGEAHGRFAPLEPALVARLREAYEADLAEIDRRFPGCLLRFDR